MTALPIGAVLLAAGSSTRMRGKSKLLRQWEGIPLVRRQTLLLREAGFSPVVVVSGASHPEVSQAVSDCQAVVIENRDWATGIGSSIACGIQYLDTIGVGAALIFPCDLPLASLEDLRVFFEASRGDQSCIAALQDDGRTPGAPALFGRAHFESLMRLSGDAGARGILRSLHPMVLDLPRLVRDADTPEAWTRLESRP